MTSLRERGKILKALVAFICIILVSVTVTGCTKTEEERFYKNKSYLEVIESKNLHTLKDSINEEILKNYNISDMYISIYYDNNTASGVYMYADILTAEKQHVTYRVESKQIYDIAKAITDAEEEILRYNKGDDNKSNYVSFEDFIDLAYIYFDGDKIVIEP